LRINICNLFVVLSSYGAKVSQHRTPERERGTPYGRVRETIKEAERLLEQRNRKLEFELIPLAVGP
jgi:hypothetical protein